MSNPNDVISAPQANQDETCGDRASQPHRRFAVWRHVVVCMLISLSLAADASAQSSVIAALPSEPTIAAAGSAVNGTEGDFEKPNQSRVFYHAGRWWLIAPEQGSQEWVLWKHDSGSWDHQGIVIGSDGNDRPDCVVDGPNNKLYVLVANDDESKMVRLTYDGGSWEIDSGFPRTVSSTIITDGEDTACLSRAKNGELWAFQIISGDLLGVYSNDDGWSWSSTITIKSDLNDGKGLVDCAPFSSNGSDYMGVAYGENTSSNSIFGFLRHRDGDSSSNWVDETSDLPPFDDTEADDHINMAVADDGTVYLITKTDGGGNSTIDNGLYKRSPGGNWQLFAVNRGSGWTRPALAIDETNNEIYAFGTLEGGTKKGLYRKIEMGDESNLEHADELVVFESGGTDFVNLSVAQHPSTASSGLLVTVQNDSDGDIWYNLMPIEGTPQTPPPAPSNLIAAANSDSSIDLSWIDESTDEDGFKLERHAGDGSFAEIAMLGVDTESFHDAGLNPSTTYTYRLLAFNPEGNSGFSNEASATTMSGGSIPAAPDNLIALATGAASIDVSWTDQSSNEDGFKVERHGGDGNFTEIGSTSAGVANYSDSGLSSNTAYFYRVFAFNSDGNSAYSNQAAAVTDTASVTPPQAPDDIDADTVDDTTIVITWDDNSDVEDGFKIERHSGNGIFAEIASTAAGVETHLDTGLNPATTYTYRLRAFNSGGFSAYTAEDAATTSGTLAPPAAPDSLTAFAISESTIDLSWRDLSSTEDGFEIERMDSLGVFNLIATVGSGIATYQDSGLSAGTGYTYRVRAFNAGGKSNYSGEAAATTVAADVNVALNKPATASDSTDFRPPSNAVDGDLTTLCKIRVISTNEWLRFDLKQIYDLDRLAIFWHARFYATSYEVQVSTNDSTWTTVASVSGGAGDQETVTFVPVAARYVRLWLLASNDPESYRIQDVEVYGTRIPLAFPSALTASALGDTAIELNWQDNTPDEDGFKIERQDSTGAFVEIATVGANVTSLQDIGLNAGTSYTYRVRAFNVNDMSDYSNLATAMTRYSSVNIALNKPASASDSTDFKPPANAVDGDRNTLCKVKVITGNEWLQIDLQQIYHLSRAVVFWNARFYALRYDILVSNDDSTWTTVASIDSGVGDQETIVFAPVAARYVRLRLLTSNDPESYRFQDVEIYGTPAVPDAPQSLTAAAASDSTISLSWEDRSSNESGFKLERQDASGSFVEIATLDSNMIAYADNGLQPSTRYVYRLLAFNDVGVSAYSDTASATTLAGITEPVTLTFNPVADAHVESETPSVVFGTKNVLEIKYEDDDKRIGYLQFEVTGLQSAVTSAFLRLEVLGGSEDGGTAFLVSNNFEGTNTPWTETGLNWNNAPDVDGDPLGSVGAVAEDEWVEFDLTAAFAAGDGIYSFAIMNDSDDRAKYYSRESDSQPELVITMGQSSSVTLLSSNSDSLSKSGANDGSSQEEAGDIVAAQAGVPQVMALHQNYPNPFNPATTITYSLPAELHVKLLVYNISGQRLRTLVNRPQQQGHHSVVFDAGGLPSGTYLVVLKAGSERLVKRMVLMK